MTGLTTASALATCAAAPPPLLVSELRVLGGFFEARAQPVVPQDADPPLFLRYTLAPAGWTEFRDKLDGELERAKGDGRRVKVIYWVRHAEGFHNAKDREVGTPRWEAEFAKTEAFLDAELTPFGIADAQRKGVEPLRRELAKGMPPIERVVVSPMSRAIQTAQHFLAGQAPTPFVAMELCRETLGVHTCDKRRTLSELRRKFQDVNFDYKTAAMADEEDTWWQPDHRETSDEIQARAREFLKQLFALVPERHVAVVAHSGFIEAVCAVTLRTTIHAANCEAIPMVLELPVDDA
jgi:broad specificity phosphatase PhoE